MDRKITRKDAERYHELVIHVVDRSSQDLGLIAFEKEDGRQLVLACLYATIVQSTRECLYLMSQPTIAVPTILRSILESYADLRGLIEDRDHALRMFATFESEKRRLLERMIDSPANPYLRDIALQLDSGVELSKVEAEIERLRRLGHTRMTNSGRLEHGGLENEHAVYYWLLCLYGHNSVSILEQRHINKHGDDYALIAVKDNSVDVCGWCDVLVSILNDATVRLYGFLNIRRLGRYEEDGRDLAGLRKEVFGR
jgi:Family of unknown function (DUF5677)